MSDPLPALVPNLIRVAALAAPAESIQFSRFGPSNFPINAPNERMTYGNGSQPAEFQYPVPAT
jgi:hypothetical protein